MKSEQSNTHVAIRLPLALRATPPLSIGLAAILLWACPMTGHAVLPDSLSVDVGDLDGDGTNDVLVLEKRSVRATGFVLKTWSVADGYQDVAPPQVRTYRGYVQGNPNMRVNASLNPNGTLSANLSDGRAIIQSMEDMPVSINGPEDTVDPGSGSTEIPWVEDRISPTPVIGDTIPKPPMRSIGLGIEIWNDWWLEQGISIDEAVAIAEQKLNDTDFVYARDMGVTWDLSTIVIRLDDYTADRKDSWQSDIAPTLAVHPDAVTRFWTSGNVAGGNILDPADPTKIVYSNIGGLGISSIAMAHELGHHFEANHSKSWHDAMDRAASCLGSGNVERMIVQVHERGTAENCPEVDYASPLPPHAREDAVNTMMDTAVDIDVLENDYDGNGDSISVSAVDASSKYGGSLTILGNGKVRYDPPAHWVGQDFFYYTVTDATGIGNTRGYVVVYVRNNGLASHYTFEESDGLIAYDLGPYQAHAYAINNNLNGTTGLVGGGVDDNTELVAHNTGDPLDGDLSVSLWVKYSTIPTDAGGLIKKRRYRKDNEATNASGWMMGHNAEGKGFKFTGELQRGFQGFNGNSTDAFNVTSISFDSISTNTWYHLVMTIDRTGKVIRGWVNNTEIYATNYGTAVPDGIIAKSHTPLQIAYNSGDYVLDDLRIYNKVLTPSEVAALYAAAGTEDIAAGAPSPRNGADLLPGQALSWVAGKPNTYEFDVYGGTDYTAVLNATPASAEYKGRQTVNEYAGTFPLNTQYYWRVDEVNGPTVITGDVWGFHTGGIHQPVTIANPGFEAPVVQPYDLRSVVNNWYGEGNTAWEGAADVPATPYGDNWAEPDYYMFQKIGTWAPGQTYEVELLLGAGNITNAFEGVELSLHTGEGKEYVSVRQNLGNTDDLYTPLIDLQTVAPAITALGTSEQTRTLGTGSSGLLGDPLWLKIQKVDGSDSEQRIFVDNIRIRKVNPSETFQFLSEEFVVQPDDITAIRSLNGSFGTITATVVASDSTAGPLSIAQYGAQSIGVLNETTDEGPTSPQLGRIGSTQMLTLSFDTPVRIDGIALNNLLATSTGREIARVGSPAFAGLNYDTTPEVFTNQTADIATFGYAGSAFRIQHSTAASNVEPEILFGVDGYDSIFLDAGQTITFECDTTDGLPTQGGYGLDSITVTVDLTDTDNNGTPDLLDPDDDGDGIPDDWESQYFNGPTNAVAEMDSDGDGYNNFQEYITGSIPTNSGSFFAVTNFIPHVGGGGFVVEWPSIPDRYYSVLWSTNLTHGFQIVEPDLEHPQNSYTDSGNIIEPQGFYKVDVRLKQ